MLNRLNSFLADRSLLSKGLWLALLPLTPLVVTSALIYVLQGFQREAVVGVLRSQNIQSNLRELSAILGDAEAGQRAYLLTGDSNWRASVDERSARLNSVVDRLSRAAVDTSQRDRFEQLGSRLREHLATLNDTIAAPVSAAPRGPIEATDIRDDVMTLVTLEQQSIGVHVARSQRVRRTLLLVAAIGAVAGIGSGVFVLLLFTSGISSRLRVLNHSAHQLAEGRALPAAPAGRDEIGTLGRSLHQAAALLAEREHELRRALEALDRFFTLGIDPLCIAGFDGYFKRLNPAWNAILGWSPEELMTKPFLEFVHPDDREATMRETQKIGAGTVTVSFENRYRCRDGTYRWLQWMAAPDVERQLIYAVARDVTLAKEADVRSRRLAAELAHRNAQLTALNQELEAFSYSVSHDLRAPLRSIDGFGQVLLEDYGDRLDGEGRDALQRVRGAAGAMGQLIDALLALSRITRVELRAERVDLSEVAAAIAAELRASEPGRTSEFVIAPGMIAHGDRTLLTAVLRNLLGNAWKYSQRQAITRIEFGHRREGDDVVYFVRDNGVGFDMAYVGKLFGAFQRLHRQTDFSGTGIGLATVQRILHRHGGRAWAEGAVDRGATFYFTLPTVVVESLASELQAGVA